MTGEIMVSPGTSVACGDLERYLANDRKVSIRNDQEKFLEIISRSVDPQISETVVAEIKTNQEKFKVKHLMISLLCLTVLSLMAYAIWPRTKPQTTDGAWDELNKSPEPYETEGTLYKDIEND